MQKINYFKLQAKNLFRDWKLSGLAEQDGNNKVVNEGRYFNVSAIVKDFNVDNSNFKLMHAQHIISKLAGCQKWTDFNSFDDNRMDTAKEVFGESVYLTNQNRRHNLIGFFKDQADYYFRVWSNRTISHTDYNGDVWYDYEFDDFFSFLMEFDFDEENFTLDNAKEIVRVDSGFAKWDDIEKASLVDLQIAKLIYFNVARDDADKLINYFYEKIEDINFPNDTDKLNYFKKVFLPKYDFRNYE